MAKRHWVCPSGHRWEAAVAPRTRKGVGCGKCAARHTSAVEVVLRSEIGHFLPEVAAETVKIDASPIGLTDRRRWPTVDVLLPSLRIAIEYDSEYFHRDKQLGDLRKTETLRALGFRVIRVRAAPLTRLSEHDLVVTEPALAVDDSMAVIAAAVLRQIEAITGIVIAGVDEYEAAGVLAERTRAEAARVSTFHRAPIRVLEPAPEMPPVATWEPTQLPQVVQASRLARAETPTAFAARLGVGVAQYMKWERGTALPTHWQFIDALANELGEPLADVYRLCGKRRGPRLTPGGIAEAFVPLPPDEWSDAGFGAALRSLRRVANRTQTEVGSAFGVTGGAVSTWELGLAYPSDGEAVRALEQYFDVPPGALAELIPVRPARIESRAQRIIGPCTCGRNYDSLRPGKLAHLIAHRRLELGLSQQALASRLSTVQAVISRWERGAALPLRSRLLDLAQALNVPVDVMVAAHPEMADVGPFARTVVSYRLKYGLTQAQAAMRLGCTQAIVSKWERGPSVPWPSKVVQLSQELGVPRDELLAMLNETRRPKRPNASVP